MVDRFAPPACVARASRPNTPRAATAAPTAAAFATLAVERPSWTRELVDAMTTAKPGGVRAK